MILRLLLSCVLAFSPLQGLGGNAGIGGNAGVGGGAVAGGGNVAFDNHCTSATVSANSANCTLTISASAKMAVVYAYVASATISVSTVTGAGTATQCTGGTITGSSETLEAWCIPNPSTGSQTITVTWSLGTGPAAMAVETFTGGTATYTVITPCSGTTSPSGCSGSSATSHYVADGLGKDEGNCTTPTASGTGQAVVDNTACTASAVSLTTSKIAGAATVSPIWTMTNDPHWNEIMVDVE